MNRSAFSQRRLIKIYCVWLCDMKASLFVVEDAKQGTLRKTSRTLNRIIPVLSSCRAELTKIGPCVTSAIEQYFSSVSTEDTQGKSYKLLVKVRNNNDGELSQLAIIKVVGEAIRESHSEWKVDLDNPQLVVGIDVLKKVCCISVIHDYTLYKKFNIQELVVSHQTEEAVEKSNGRFMTHSSDTPSGGVTDTPSGGVTDTPSGGVTDTPSGGVTDTPSGGVTDTPSGGVTDTPSSGVTDTPSGGVTDTPSGGTTDTPSSGVTGTPSSGVTDTPSGGVTETPSGGVTETPSGGTTDTPSSGLTSAMTTDDKA
ncbi:THUMPD1 [Bugula neritina]|uniref:THUMPD1 n=1 Tax=Bugula neritina TaxID=10212 RepID=A0A7J7KP28_BUGNE|nr:THUMPD1 [Bugula neritina]